MAEKWSEAELPLFGGEERINDPDRALKALRKDAADCTRCDLYKNATQTVFGEGPAEASIMLVGEQPGDQEDIAGHPFVGPAGKLLDRALSEAEIPRDELYVTNAVKHFKNEPRGKRRIHKKPDTGEIEACRWWFDRELAVVRPSVVVALGATAARAVLRKTVTISKTRGELIDLTDGIRALVTVHPSYLLRLRDEADKKKQFRQFVADLRFAAERAGAKKAA